MSFKKLLPIFFVILSFGAKANYMLVQNVTKVGNNPTNKTIQIQFDLSWQNSWRDSINWDAAWIFIKYKNANGLWQHARLNLAGYLNGAGTSNIVKVASDSVGAFVYRSVLGSGNFNATSMQLQWNYGASGLTDASALEVRVFATEMVYVPEGDFNCAKEFKLWWSSEYISITASNNNFAVINKRMSPSVIYHDFFTDYQNIFERNTFALRIKGDVGIDINNDGVVDNTNFPTGYRAFYCYKYELTEQQYADFLNTLTGAQISNLGNASNGIYLSNSTYFSSTPNKACGSSSVARFLSYGDWCGLRPMSFLEFNKVSYGPLQPVGQNFQTLGYPASGSANYTNNFNASSQLINVGSFANSITDRSSSGSSYYGCMDLTGNAHEPVVRLSRLNFTNINGDGILDINGNNNVLNWENSMVNYIDAFGGNIMSNDKHGFRYVRSAE